MKNKHRCFLYKNDLQQNALAGHLLGLRQAQQLEHGGGNVSQNAALTQGYITGTGHQEGHGVGGVSGEGRTVSSAVSST